MSKNKNMAIESVKIEGDIYNEYKMYYTIDDLNEMRHRRFDERSKMLKQIRYIVETAKDKQVDMTDKFGCIGVEYDFEAGEELLTAIEINKSGMLIFVTNDNEKWCYGDLAYHESWLDSLLENLLRQRENGEI